MKHALSCALALSVSVAARAQTTPPAPMPVVPDEPLPEWHAPVKKPQVPIFLTISPELIQAQKLRQAGLFISAIGWVQFFLAGILYVKAGDDNTLLSNARPIASDVLGNAIVSFVFDPALEDERNHLEAASLSLVIVGGAMALGGFVMFTMGQARISRSHKNHPRDPLPPLSGY